MQPIRTEKNGYGSHLHDRCDRSTMKEKQSYNLEEIKRKNDHILPLKYCYISHDRYLVYYGHDTSARP
jgi:hypothetical protein